MDFTRVTVIWPPNEYHREHQHASEVGLGPKELGENQRNSIDYSYIYREIV